MMLSLPKIQRSNGKMVETVIDASEIKGMDSYTMNGKTGSKVYTSNGWFFVPAPPMLIATAKHAALTTGEPQMITAPKVKVVQEVPEIVSIPMKAHKMIGNGNHKKHFLS